MLLYFLCLYSSVLGQYLTLPPDGDSNHATVAEQIGITNVTVHYSRPGVKGREGKIWGELVPYGFVQQGFGPNKPAPWRAGANENTTVTFSHDVNIEGQPLAAGTYALFIAVQPEQCTIIFSKNSTSWGSYFYNESEDALRVVVKPEKLPYLTERLKYEFSDQKSNSVKLALVWEYLKIPFKIEVDIHKTVLTSIRNELRGDKGFAWQAWQQAATYCLEHSINLEEALQWAEYAINGQFVGVANYQTLSTKAMILERLGRKVEADKDWQLALEYATVNEIHNYARKLLQEKRVPEAVAAFELNFKKNGDAWPVHVGLMRGYSAAGDYKKALKHAKLALAQAPDEVNKKSLTEKITMLEAGKDIN